MFESQLQEETRRELEMSKARVKVNFVSMADARTVIVNVSGLTRDEQRKLRAVVDNRVLRFVDTVNRKEKACQTGSKLT